jgi:DNA end-binding protein Ku
VPETDVPDDAIRARTFWSGTISFGLVSIPVALLAAHRSARVPLRMVTADGTPLQRRYHASADDRALESDEIVRGYEIDEDRFVVVDDDELERLAPERTRDIDLRLFVPVESIDPMHFQRAYYLAPAGGSNKAYRLLARVMEESGRAGIATFVMRAREYLVAILAENGILRAETLRFADEVRAPEQVGLPEPRTASAADVKRMRKAIDPLVRRGLAVAELEDPSGERLEALARRKAKGGRVVKRVEAVPEPDDGVIDLMAVLKRSLERGADDDGSARRPARGGAASVAELRRSTRAELYERARELDIDGRSGMTKDQLVDALRRSA